jgi:hypothetical protein
VAHKASRTVRADRGQAPSRPWGLASLGPYVYGLPGVLVHVLTLIGIGRSILPAGSPLVLAANSLMAVVGLILLCVLLQWTIRQGLFWRLLAPLARFRLQPAVYPVLGKRAAYYLELMQVHPNMLLMKPKTLATRAGLYRWEAEFLVHHPDFVPRVDIEECIRRALMVPFDWPRRGYGEECTKERLIWYASKGKLVWTALDVEAATRQSRADALRVLEAQRRDELGKSSGATRVKR